MKTKPIFALILISFFPVGYTQNLETTSSMEERVATLESGLVSLDARFETRTTVGAGSLGSSNAGLDARARIDTLERRINDLGREVGNLRRQLDAATREATAARRDARAALSRVR